MRAELLLALLLAVPAAGCVGFQDGGNEDTVTSTDKASVPGEIDGFRVIERDVEGYGTCKFAVVSLDDSKGHGGVGGAGITLIGCQDHGTDDRKG